MYVYKVSVGSPREKAESCFRAVVGQGEVRPEAPLAAQCQSRAGCAAVPCDTLDPVTVLFNTI